MKTAGMARVLLGTLLLWAATPARAELGISVKLGWDGRVRNGRWNPIVVTLQNPTPVGVELQLYTPRDASQAILTRVGGATAQPVAQTYILYAPIVVGPDAITLKVLDSATHKTLGEAKLVDPDRVSLYGNGAYNGDLYVHRAGIFVGVSGVEPVLKELGAAALEPRETVGYLKPDHLPQIPMGFDALDVLVLNQPDLNTLEGPQKKAILDWVRAGGKLLVWFAPGPLAPDDPLVRALPCTVGDNTTLEPGRDELARVGLPERFGKLGGRVLVPAAGARVVNVLGGGGAKAVYGRYGFGGITVLSFDGSTLLFRDNRQAREFWEPLLQLGSPGTIDLYAREYDRSEDQAPTTRLMDLLGGVPGVGTFGFGYVAITLIALMFIVGPIDWLVLKWLGRQPWTWVTTTGWIALVTIAAIYMGHLVRSGDLHLRTLRVVDQADGVVVARTDYVGIYSPRTDDYQLEPSPDSWWEPLTSDRYYYASNAVVNVLNCRQSQRDSVPDSANPMTIPVWNLRFLSGQTIGKGDAMIDASLQIRPPSDTSVLASDRYLRLVGTITNRTDLPITQLKVQARGCMIDVSGASGRGSGDKVAAGIPPHGTVTIDLPVRSDRQEPGQATTRRFEPHALDEEVVIHPFQVLWLAERLNAGRARRVTEIVPEKYATPPAGVPEVACVSALVEGAPAAATLKGRQPIEKHWIAVRALVKLQAGEGK